MHTCTRAHVHTCTRGGGIGINGLDDVTLIGVSYQVSALSVAFPYLVGGNPVSLFLLSVAFPYLVGQSSFISMYVLGTRNKNSTTNRKDVQTRPLARLP